MLRSALDQRRDCAVDAQPLQSFHERCQQEREKNRESEREDFLVLSGECLLIVEGQERRLRAWDLFHAAPNTTHAFVGAGDGPCVIFMVGARSDDGTILYPRDETALKHGAGVEQDTPSPSEAYASFGHWRLGRPDLWDDLPWSR